MSDNDTQINLDESPKPTLEEQAAQMAKESGDQVETSGRPEWLPEKFDNPESMAEAYSNLEKKMGAGEHLSGELKIEKADGSADGEGAEGADAPITMEDLKSYGEEWASNNGSLKEESYDALEQRGITRDVVQAFVQAQLSQTQAEHARSMAEAGIDTDAWREMSVWASTNWSEDQQNAWNELAANPNPLSRKLALDHLKNAYSSARGQSSRLIDGEAAPQGMRPFRSTAEMMEQMKDPRYDKDEAFRKEVDYRIQLGLTSQ